MADTTLADVEDALERATDLPAAEALDVLRSARADLETLRDRGEVGDEAARTLADRLNQRIREVREREAYDAGLGAAMEPEDEDAP